MRSLCCRYNYAVAPSDALEAAAFANLDSEENLPNEEKTENPPKAESGPQRKETQYVCLKCLEVTELEVGTPLVESCELTLEEILNNPKYKDLKQARKMYLRTLMNYGIAPNYPLSKEFLDQITAEGFTIDRENLLLGQFLDKSSHRYIRESRSLQLKFTRLENLCALLTAPYYGNPHQLPVEEIMKILRRVYNPVKSNTNKWAAIHWLTFVLNLPEGTKITKGFIIRILVSIIFGRERTISNASAKCFWSMVKGVYRDDVRIKQLLHTASRHLMELVNPAIKPFHGKRRLGEIIKKRRRILGAYAGKIASTIPYEDQHGNTTEKLMPTIRKIIENREEALDVLKEHKVDKL